MFMSTQLCQDPPCLHAIPTPFSSQYRLYFLLWHRNTLAPFFLCYLYRSSVLGLFTASSSLQFSLLLAIPLPCICIPRLLCVLLLFAFFHHCSTQFSFTCCHIMCYGNLIFFVCVSEFRQGFHNLIL